MSAIVDDSECESCQACMEVCQFNAISWDTANERPIIDPNKCTECAACIYRCPMDAIEIISTRKEPR